MKYKIKLSIEDVQQDNLIDEWEVTAQQFNMISTWLNDFEYTGAKKLNLQEELKNE